MEKTGQNWRGSTKASAQQTSSEPDAVKFSLLLGGFFPDFVVFMAEINTPVARHL